MKKEYISPSVYMLDVQLENSILVSSFNNPKLEDFVVSDGEW